MTVVGVPEGHLRRKITPEMISPYGLSEDPFEQAIFDEFVVKDSQLHTVTNGTLTSSVPSGKVWLLNRITLNFDTKSLNGSIKVTVEELTPATTFFEFELEANDITDSNSWDFNPPIRLKNTRGGRVQTLASTNFTSAIYHFVEVDDNF